MRAVAPGVLALVLAASATAAKAQPAPDRAGAAQPEAQPTPKTGPRPEPGAGGVPRVPGASGPAPRPAARLGRHTGPWLLIGGSIGLVTMGAVLAYSANAAERDVEDLYVGLNGTPPPFNDATRKLYDDAIAEGRRYQALSIASFGLAGAMAIGAAVWFALDRDERIAVAPAVAPGAAGISTAIRF